MSRNCPARYLRKELEVLRPTILLAYGAPAHGALRELGAVTIEEDVDGFRRGRVLRCTVFLLTHPAHGGWHPAHRALLASLKAAPVNPST